MKKVTTVFTGLMLFVCSLHASPLFQPPGARARSITAVGPSEDERELARYVNPFVGTDGDGNTFPGPTVPFGMMQWSPDTTADGFYRYRDSKIRGFSLTHLSGAGCPAYADIPFLPTLAPIKVSPGVDLSDYAPGFSHQNEEAAPGYYGVRLDSGIRVRLSVTARSGFGVFTYPTSQAATLLINAGGSAKADSDSAVEIIGDREVVGSATSGAFCDSPTTYTIYFAAEFERPFKSSGTWNASTVSWGSHTSRGKQSGAILSFDTRESREVRVKVGISFVSTQNALLNLRTENPGWDFDAVRRQAAETWNEWLGRVRVEGGTTEQRETFYTALYHALIAPNLFSDVNGEFKGFDRAVHKAQGYTHYANFSDWDTYRTVVQLQALLAPRQTGDMMQSLVVDAEQSGWLPKWEFAGDVTSVMGGDNPTPLIATAYAFGAQNFDARAALRFMLKGATQAGTGIHGYRERPGLSDYLQRGYVPLYALGSTNGVNGAASVTLEYTSDDFAIAQFAKSLGDVETSRTFMRRAQNWQNLFNAETGFIHPRRLNGILLEGFDPDRVSPHSETPWDKSSQAGFEEGNSWQYTWMIPYNYRGLFQAIGGDRQAIERLDRFFTKLVGWGEPYFNIGNEPSFVSPYAYTFAHAPWRTQKVVRRIMTEIFHPTPGGIPGNDDLGATSAWYLWSALGLYPAIPGVGGFVISSPLFPTATIRLGDGRELRISAGSASADNIYVESLDLNGKPYAHAWLPMEAVRAGTNTLDFKLGEKPNPAWAAGPADVPPSFTDGQAPAIPFIYGDDSLRLTPGGQAPLLLGVRKISSGPLEVRWRATAPPGLSLQPSSGVMRIRNDETPKLEAQVIVSVQAAPGSYTVPIKFQVSSRGEMSGRTLPDVVVGIIVRGSETPR